MYLSEVGKICTDEIAVLRDGSFDIGHLIGKERTREGKVVTFMTSIEYLDIVLSEKVDCVICNKEIAETVASKFEGGIAISKNAKTSFFEIHNHLATTNYTETKSIIDESAIIHPTAIVDKYGVSIGKNTIIHANAIIKSGSVIGDDCVIRENVIVGTPGFYYYGNGNNKKLVNSAGGVRIGKNVELHPGTVIEKGVLYGDTIIGDNSKLDNLILIGHDSKIGNDCVIAASTTFAGGVRFGNGAFAGVGVVIAPNVSVGNSAKLSSGAVVTKDVHDGEHVSGNFAIEHKMFIKHIKDIS